MDNNIYYKLYKNKKLNYKITISTLQWFDEVDYNYGIDAFLKNKDGSELKFYDYNEAVRWVNDNIKRDMIDPDILLHGDNMYYKESD